MKKGRIVQDTSDYFAIDYGDQIKIDGKLYNVLGNAKESRFGMEDPKYWVKRAIDVELNEKKFIKLVFFESFITTLGGVKINCFRDPDKEGKVLGLVKDHPGFMHGTVHRDSKNNNIRVLDVVRGQNFYSYIDSLTIDYETYFYNMLPDLLKNLIYAFESIFFLHINDLKHGDIRNDHIIIESGTGRYVWIDFDYDYDSGENPFSLDIFGIGNILVYCIGKGFYTYYNMMNDRDSYGDLVDRVDMGDFSILVKGRFMNLRKIYPFIPKMLNDILMHFSNSANVYYESVAEIIQDLKNYLYSLHG